MLESIKANWIWWAAAVVGAAVVYYAFVAV